VQDLNGAMAAAECLVDYATEPQKQKDKGSSNKSGGGSKSQGSGKPKSGGADGAGSSGGYKNNNKYAGKDYHKESKNKGPLSCWLCQGPHKVADCPQKKALNALQAHLGTREHTRGQSDSSDDEEETCSRRSVPRVGAFHMVNAVKKQAPKPKVAKGKGVAASPRQVEDNPEKPKNKKGKVSNTGLMFVDIRVNGKPIRALIDTGATHNFVAGTEVERLGLSLEKDDSRIKAVNSAAQPIRKVSPY
jgi:hypothetical protein